MTEVEEIPEDVMKAAEECYDGLPIVYDGWDEDNVRACIARAIMKFNDEKLLQLGYRK